MTGPLAIPTFVAGAKDDVAAADVYKQTTSAAINSVQVVQERTDLLNASGLRSGKSSLTDLKSTFANAKSLFGTAKSALALGLQLKNLATGPGDILSRLSQAGGIGNVLSGGLKNLAPSLGSTVFGNISSLGGLASAAANIGVTVNGITKQIKAGNFANVSGISSLINQVTGGATSVVLNDVVGSAAGFAGVIKTAQDFKMPNSFGAICSTLTNGRLINQISGLTLPSCLKNGDLGSLTSMADLTSAGALKMLNPNLVSNFTNLYNTLPGKALPELTSDFTQMKQTFGKIDPPWATAPRATINGFEEVPNITCVQDASPDFLDAMHAGIKSDPNSPDKFLLLGTVYPKTDVAAEVQKQFPQIVLSTPAPSNVSPDPVVQNVTRTTATSYTSVSVTTSGGGVHTSYADMTPSDQLSKSASSEVLALAKTQGQVQVELDNAETSYQNVMINISTMQQQAEDMKANGGDPAVIKQLEDRAQQMEIDNDHQYIPLIKKLEAKISDLDQQIAVAAASARAKGYTVPPLPPALPAAPAPSYPSLPTTPTPTTTTSDPGNTGTPLPIFTGTQTTTGNEGPLLDQYSALRVAEKDAVIAAMNKDAAFTKTVPPGTALTAAPGYADAHAASVAEADRIKATYTDPMVALIPQIRTAAGSNVIPYGHTVYNNYKPI